LPHRVEVGDLRRAPRGQLPWIDLDGQVIGDSTLIIDALERHNVRPLNAGLNPAQLARGWALTRTLEESTVWALRHQRFADSGGWTATRQVVQSLAPPLLRGVLPTVVRRGMLSALQAQGAGRYDCAFQRSWTPVSG
jgi:glutathione S-transferase